jgi:hypothetical protein
MKRKYIIAMSITLFLLSCTNMDVRHRKITFSNEKMLVAEKIRVDEIFSPDFITKKEDCFIIAGSKSDTMLYMYSLPSFTSLGGMGIKGQGPGEIQLFPMFCESPGSRYLYIWGYTPLTINKILINECGGFMPDGEHQLSRYEAFNCMHIINDSLFIYYLPDDLTVKKYDLKANKYIDEIKWPKDDHAESYYYSNRGWIAVNDSNIVYSYVFKKQIEIYDLHTCEKKTVITDGRKYPKPDLKSNENPACYMNIYAGINYFYALCMNNDSHGSQADYLLEVFDYEGNPIIKYTFDIAPSLFVVDEDRGHIYGYSHMYEDYLLRYDMI